MTDLVNLIKKLRFVSQGDSSDTVTLSRATVSEAADALERAEKAEADTKFWENRENEAVKRAEAAEARLSKIEGNKA